MRKTQKSALYKSFVPLSKPPELKNPICVIDGGYLLHKVVWTDPKKYVYTYNDVVKMYVKYLNNYRECIVVFDGYAEESRSIKNTEQLRRLQKNFCPDVNFTESTIVTVPQNKFLRNRKNKENFIKLIDKELKNYDKIKCIIAEEDADLEIIKAAISMEITDHDIIVIGEDIDLLVILTQLTTVKDKTIYFYKPQIGKVIDEWYTQHSFQVKNLNNIIMFVHAFCGCDTVSAFYGQGIKKFIDIFKKFPELVK